MLYLVSKAEAVNPETPTTEAMIESPVSWVSGMLGPAPARSLFCDSFMIFFRLESISQRFKKEIEGNITLLIRRDKSLST